MQQGHQHPQQQINIAQLTSEIVSNAYHGRMNMFSMAATIASLPNGLTLLEQQMDLIKQDVELGVEQLKTNLEGHVSPADLLDARQAVGKIADQTLEQCQQQFNELMQLVADLNK